MSLVHGAATAAIPQWPDLSGLWMGVAGALFLLCVVVLFTDMN